MGAGGGRTDGRARCGPGRAAGRLPPLGGRSWLRGSTRGGSRTESRPEGATPARRTHGGAAERSGRPVTTTLRPTATAGGAVGGPAPVTHRAGRVPAQRRDVPVLLPVRRGAGATPATRSPCSTGPDPELTRPPVEGLRGPVRCLPTWHPNADAGPPAGAGGSAGSVGRCACWSPGVGSWATCAGNDPTWPSSVSCALCSTPRRWPSWPGSSGRRPWSTSRTTRCPTTSTTPTSRWRRPAG